MNKFKNWRLQGAIKQYDFRTKEELKEHYKDLISLKNSVNKDLKRIEKVLGEF